MKALTDIETNAGSAGTDGTIRHVGHVVRTEGEFIVFQSTLSSPPGSHVTFRLDGTERRYKVKVRGCRKTDDAEHPFRIEGRLVDLSREQRDAIAVPASKP